TILSDKPVKLSRVPHLKDISTTLELLKGIGAKVSHEGGVASIEIPSLTSTEAPYELVRTMRASILMLGPLLARARNAKVSLPGGCSIGTRPVDIHLQALEKMGATLKLEAGYIVGECAAGLRGAEIEFRFPSVGATEHVMMAACLAKGETVIRNAAREPEIVDLAQMLRKMGAGISGEGSSEIRILGASVLRPVDHEVMFDRIEAGTLLLAGPITGGKVRVNRVDPEALAAFTDLLKQSGVKVEIGADWIEAERGVSERGLTFSTAPFPGFPTDLQAQFMAYLAQIGAQSEIQETIFENRFMHVPELNRLGADIRVEGGSARIFGKRGCFQGAVVMATDLRASASLVLAGLAAKGQTTVRRIYHLDRGYEELEKKLLQINARIARKLD
ncbi:MAG: UDP-N-acetylglucosamine 1-carboxyvinyltransferase, partial [Bdellovibrionota bacterium]